MFNSLKEKFHMKLRFACVIVGCLSLVFSLAAQTAGSGAASAQVPPLIQFSNVATDEGGNTLSGAVSITFSFYTSQQGGEPLWTETQNNVPLDPTGHYSVQLGVTKVNGVPTTLFTTGAARWLGVRIAEQLEQPRVLLLSVPYALKAGDAATIGGLPASAFVLAGSQNGAAVVDLDAGQSAPPPAGAITGTGTVNYLPLWDSTSDIVSSVLFQSGTGSTAKVGIGTTTPYATLDVKGGSTIRGTLSLPATAAATATAGKDSQPLNLVASAFSSTTSASVNQTFQWKAEPAANDTASPSGTLNLLYGLGTTAPSETGLQLSSTGLFTFATKQSSPGTGDGSVKSVALAAPASDSTVSESPVTGTGTLGFAWNVPPTNADTADAIVKRDASGNFIAGTITATGLTATSASISTGMSIPSRAEFPLNVTSSNVRATSILGQATATTGDAWGVEGLTSSSASDAYGVYGTAQASTGTPIGVYGSAPYSPSGIGVFGQNGPESAVGEAVSNAGISSGVWGDSGTSNQYGVIGTATYIGGYFVSEGWSAWLQNTSSTGIPFIAGYGSTIGALSKYCEIDTSGNILCTGTKNAAVPVDGGQRVVALSAIEAPQNWFEDAGEAEMVKGAAVVQLDSTYTQTVNTDTKYQVFLTPYGDCRGLYVTNRTANSFEVHELGGGTASLSFGYRIMGLRKQYENVRFADHTRDFGGNNGMLVRAPHPARATNRQSHMPSKNLSPPSPFIPTTAVR